MKANFVPFIKGIFLFAIFLLLIHWLIFLFRLPEFQQKRDNEIQRLTWLVFSNEQIAEAIYRAEGGRLARKPFGILSVPVSGYASARRACLETIDYHRNLFSNRPDQYDFISFIGKTYCPPKAHPLNRVWVRNVKQILLAEVIK